MCCLSSLVKNSKSADFTAACAGKTEFARSLVIDDFAGVGLQWVAMKHPVTPLVAAALVFAAAFFWRVDAPAAEPAPLVAELFTSQGCNSCPPADRLLGELARRDDVLPLSFHVTYWDRLGWRDTFGLEDGTRRQERYAEWLGLSRVYTPQMVIGGRIDVVALRLRVHLGLVGREHVGDAGCLEHCAVGRERARIAVEILAGAELQAIDEDARDHIVGVLAGLLHQGDVAGVQVAHGGHEGDRAGGGAGGAQAVDGVMDLHGRFRRKGAGVGDVRG